MRARTDWTYELHVEGVVPRALPLEALGELLQRFADLLGAHQFVRFGDLKKGSTSLCATVLPEGRDAVQLSVNTARLLGDKAPARVTRIDDYLRERGWHGALRNRAGDTLLTFPGASNLKPPEETRKVRQQDSVVGSVIKIGGRDETVPMTLKLDNGEYMDVNVRGRERARQLGAHLFGADLRFSGLATWQRDPEGNWSCIGMVVEEFETLDGKPLEELFVDLAAIPGNGWKKFDDPIDELSRMRRDD